MWVEIDSPRPTLPYPTLSGPAATAAAANIGVCRSSRTAVVVRRWSDYLCRSKNTVDDFRIGCISRNKSQHHSSTAAPGARCMFLSYGSAYVLLPYNTSTSTLCGNLPPPSRHPHSGSKSRVNGRPDASYIHIATRTTRAQAAAAELVYRLSFAKLFYYL